MTRMQHVHDRDREAALSLRSATALALAAMTAAFLLIRQPQASPYVLRTAVEPIALVDVPNLLVSPPKPEPKLRVVHSAVPVPGPQGVETDSSLLSLPGGFDSAVTVTDIEAPLAWYRVERPPVRLSQPAAEYPEICRAAGVEGRVVVHIVVGLTGGVDSAAVFVSSGNSLLDAAAVAAARRAQFRPGYQRDRPVRVLAAATFDFRLE